MSVQHKGSEDRGKKNARKKNYSLLSAERRQQARIRDGAWRKDGEDGPWHLTVTNQHTSRTYFPQRKKSQRLTRETEILSRKITTIKRLASPWCLSMWLRNQLVIETCAGANLYGKVSYFSGKSRDNCLVSKELALGRIRSCSFPPRTIFFLE